MMSPRFTAAWIMIKDSQAARHWNTVSSFTATKSASPGTRHLLKADSLSAFQRDLPNIWSFWGLWHVCTGKLTKKANFLECVDTYNFRPGDLLQHNMNFEWMWCTWWKPEDSIFRLLFIRNRHLKLQETFFFITNIEERNHFGSWPFAKPCWSTHVLL